MLTIPAAAVQTSNRPQRRAQSPDSDKTQANNAAAPADAKQGENKTDRPKRLELTEAEKPWLNKEKQLYRWFVYYKQMVLQNLNLY